jgi:hypothetical protein
LCAVTITDAKRLIAQYNPASIILYADWNCNDLGVNPEKIVVVSVQFPFSTDKLWEKWETAFLVKVKERHSHSGSTTMPLTACSKRKRGIR